MFASTNVLFAFALSPARPSPVSRCNTKPPTVTSVAAFTTVIPAVDDVNVTEQLPVVPTVKQLAALRLPGPLNFVKLIVVPAGAFAEPLPSFTFT